MPSELETHSPNQQNLFRRRLLTSASSFVCAGANLIHIENLALGSPLRQAHVYMEVGFVLVGLIPLAKEYDDRTQVLHSVDQS